MNDTVTSILQDKEFFNQYTTDLIKRQTTDSTILNDNIKATTYLFSDNIMNQNLSVETIITTANLINSSNIYISNGYRTGGTYILDTDIKMPEASLLPEIMTNLVDNYNQNLFDDIFLNEAYLHIGLVISQPFEDANHRTANLITNYNLLKKGIAPIIIDEDSKEYYYNLIYTKDTASLTSLFKSLSTKEETYLISTYKKDLPTNQRK